MIHFNQRIIISRNLPPALNRFVVKHNGLCELICNRILFEGLLDREHIPGTNLFQRKITVKHLNRPEIINSHILDVFTIFEKLFSYIFGVYPDNIYSHFEQRKLVGKFGKSNFVNPSILDPGLNSLEVGTTVKVEILRRGFKGFGGHSLLIKKESSNCYTLFDPNRGAILKLQGWRISGILNDQLRLWDANDIYILKGSDYIKRLQRKKIIRTI